MFRTLTRIQDDRKLNFLDLPNVRRDVGGGRVIEDKVVNVILLEFESGLAVNYPFPIS